MPSEIERAPKQIVRNFEEEDGAASVDEHTSLT
jgi:hypothetical protein